MSAPPISRCRQEFHYLLFRNGGIDAPAVRREIAICTLINKWDSSVEVAMKSLSSLTSRPHATRYFFLMMRQRCNSVYLLIRTICNPTSAFRVERNLLVRFGYSHIQSQIHFTLKCCFQVSDSSGSYSFQSFSTRSHYQALMTLCPHN